MVNADCETINELADQIPTYYKIDGNQGGSENCSRQNRTKRNNQFCSELTTVLGGLPLCYCTTSWAGVNGGSWYLDFNNERRKNCFILTIWIRARYVRLQAHPYFLVIYSLITIANAKSSYGFFMTQ